MNDTFWTDSLARRTIHAKASSKEYLLEKYPNCLLKSPSDVNHAAPLVYCCNVLLPSLLGRYWKSM